MVESTPLLSPFFLPSFPSFLLGNFNYHHTLWNSKGTFDSRGKEVFNWVISSTFSPSMTLAYQFFSIASLAVAPPLTSPSFPRLFSYLDPGGCFRTWVLITYEFYEPFLSLRSFAATNVPHSLIFRKLIGMTLLFTLTPTVLLQRNSRLFHFPLLLFSLLL